jgi:hypothetical protein
VQPQGRRRCHVRTRGTRDDHGAHAHGDAHHHDSNIRAAYVHVMADALTSVLAIVALLAGAILRSDLARSGHGHDRDGGDPRLAAENRYVVRHEPYPEHA